MCSNYLPVPPEALRQWNFGEPDFAYGETYPGLTAPFLANAPSDRWLPGTFGLMPHWGKDGLYRSTYNARAETVADKPAFRSAWRKLQFCVIPVAAFYEPNYVSGRPVRWRIERADAAPFGIAGLWERRRDEAGEVCWSFTMLTINADAHPLMRQFHRPGSEKRSVVILPDAAWNDWLAAPSPDAARLLLREFDPATMRAGPEPKDAPAPDLFSLE